MQRVPPLTGRHAGAVHTLAVCGDMLYSGDDAGTVCAWALPALLCVACFTACDGLVSALAVAGGGRLYAASLAAVHAWDLSAEGGGETVVRGPSAADLKHWVRALVLAADGATLYGATHATIHQCAVCGFLLGARCVHAAGCGRGCGHDGAAARARDRFRGDSFAGTGRPVSGCGHLQPRSLRRFYFVPSPTNQRGRDLFRTSTCTNLLRSRTRANWRATRAQSIRWCGCCRFCVYFHPLTGSGARACPRAGNTSCRPPRTRR